MPLITITEGIGCGGRIVADRLVDRLGLELFDDDKLQRQAEKMGIRPEAIDDLDEKAPDLFHLLLSKRPEIYLNYLESIVYAVAGKGEGVIIGHGGQVLLREFDCALHIRLHAGEATRLENVMKARGLGREAAAKLIEKSDQEQSGFFQYAFHMDWQDKSLYDLVINMEKIGHEAAAKLIAEAYGSEQMTSCSLRMVEAIRRRSLRMEIHAALLENKLQTKWLKIEVPAKGVVAVGGYIYSQEEKDKVLKIIKSMPGVSRVEEDIGTLSHLA